MDIDTLTLVFLFAILGALVWDTQRQNRKAHLHTQDILRDIARFLGTDRR